MNMNLILQLDDETTSFSEDETQLDRFGNVSTIFTEDKVLKPTPREGKPVLKGKRLFRWNVANSSEGSSASSLLTSTNYRVVSTLSQSLLLPLCVQEIFASFNTAALSIADIGSVVIEEESYGFRLANSMVSEIAELFTKR